MEGNRIGVQKPDWKLVKDYLAGITKNINYALSTN